MKMDFVIVYTFVYDLLLSNDQIRHNSTMKNMCTKFPFTEKHNSNNWYMFIWTLRATEKHETVAVEVGGGKSMTS